jgi:hydroxymethylpyrimidine pyrophosphatase-like HAD family hydrolase
MMTKNYGCGLKKSFKYFKQSIKDLLYGYNGMEINEINVIFVKFYNHISKENQITKSDVNKIIDFFKDNKKITFNDSSKTSFEYKKFKNNRIDSSYNNERYTRIIKEMSEEDDKKKYRIAIVANYIQSQDASLVR